MGKFLCDFAVGESGKVKAVLGEGRVKRRLFDMGVTPGADVTLADLARLTDAFYIGGTKLGALFGEALVIMNEDINRDFRYIEKQRGGMLAKGRLLGVQFNALMTDGLYERTAQREVALAWRLREAFAAKGWPLYCDSPTNQ